MARILYGLIALMGLAAAVANRRFATASHDSSARFFGRRVRPCSTESRFLTAWSRILAIVAGLLMFVMGTLGALGVIWNR